MPGAGSAVLSLKALGKGLSRQRALASLSVEKHRALVVGAWYPVSREIVFKNFAAPSPAEKSCKPHHAQESRQKSAKPPYKLLPKGTLFLVDCANFLGEFAPRDASPALSALASSLADEGYASHFFIEPRAKAWYTARQEFLEDRQSFLTTCDNLGVTHVKVDADTVILQIMSCLDHSVGLSCDRYTDYAEAFPDLVGSPRLREFLVTRIDGETLVTIEGVRKAIRVPSSSTMAGDPPAMEETTETPPDLPSEASEDEEFPPPRPRHERVFGAPLQGGLLGFAHKLLAEGKITAAVNILQRVSRKESRGYAALAEAFAEDEDMSAKYQGLDERSQRKTHECAIRSRRQREEGRRNRCA